MDYDKLIFKHTGFYNEIKLPDAKLVSVKTQEHNKCDKCYFSGKLEVCSLIACCGVIYIDITARVETGSDVIKGPVEE